MKNLDDPRRVAKMDPLTQYHWNWEKRVAPYRSKPWLCAYCLGDIGVPIPDACPHCHQNMLITPDWIPESK